VKSGAFCPTEAEPPDYDRAGFLARIMGKEDLAASIAEIFLGDMPSQMGLLAGALSEENLRAAELQAHKIKGAAANVGGEAMKATALAMEESARAGDIKALRLLLPELEKRFERLKQAMEKENRE